MNTPIMTLEEAKALHAKPLSQYTIEDALNLRQAQRILDEHDAIKEPAPKN